MVALIMMDKLKARGSGTAAIAREIALDMGACLYAPTVAVRTPGVSNVLADILSRLRASGEIPSALAGATQRRVPKRGRGFYLCEAY